MSPPPPATEMCPPPPSIHPVNDSPDFVSVNPDSLFPSLPTGILDDGITFGTSYLDDSSMLF
jgi:hypothetical protein